jgi:hypothetical protein
MLFKLHDFIEGALPRMIYKTSADGNSVVNSRVTFMPGEVYEAVDDTLIRLIKGEIGDVRQKSLLTSDLKQTLETNGVDYTVTKCASCSGAKPYALYNPFKILEEK